MTALLLVTINQLNENILPIDSLEELFAIIKQKPFRNRLIQALAIENDVVGFPETCLVFAGVQRKVVLKTSFSGQIIQN